MLLCGLLYSPCFAGDDLDTRSRTNPQNWMTSLREHPDIALSGVTTLVACYGVERYIPQSARKWQLLFSSLFVGYSFWSFSDWGWLGQPITIPPIDLDFGSQWTQQNPYLTALGATSTSVTASEDGGFVVVQDASKPGSSSDFDMMAEENPANPISPNKRA